MYRKQKKSEDIFTSEITDTISNNENILFFENKEAFFGEIHVHTSYSLDAYLGGTRLKPTDAYKFAKGETVEVNGKEITTSKSLNWYTVLDKFCANCIMIS
ncbi:conserved hypothetical protein (DUF3604) [Formosa agariphila KMM 3901]|uniref:DUF3604 domain-containing protein n=1 Tax=Formosa agariphila (strain DSM 15362 / KCTC 12365 / LMG 23005 / KMM 3901 / M-2Alg 35-1) TaxID=1347342 RepID=T2KMV9_FORAG|nr:DUF3604 domain-containing protein [Formosa agariphila]CDF79771.1 conserved hypothetical protein (DUF3604) [Formosa agariphila KMM 3901]